MERVGRLRVTARLASPKRLLASILIAVSIASGVVVVASPPADAWTREGVRRAIRRAWGGNDRKAIRVANCESGLNPNATSPGGTYLGLWQFSRSTWRAYGGPGNDPRDVSAYRQTVVAWRLFRDRGWSPWPSCRYA
jgi:hypothetical protein